MKSMWYTINLVVIMNLVGCASANSRNGHGLLYTDVSDSVTVTANAGMSKVGKSCAVNVLSLLSIGEMSADAAKREGSITRVASVDFTNTSVLGLFVKTCTFVRGE